MSVVEKERESEKENNERRLPETHILYCIMSIVKTALTQIGRLGQVLSGVLPFLDQRVVYPHCVPVGRMWIQKFPLMSSIY